MNGVHHTIHRLKKLVSATIVISLGTWVYQIIQNHYEIRYSQNIASNGSDVQLNIFNASASPAQIHVSLESESGGLEDLRLRLQPQSQEWSLREMLLSQKAQLENFSKGTTLTQDLDYLADRHREGGLETLRQKLLTNLRVRIADELRSSHLDIKDQTSITLRFMQLTDKHANLSSVLQQVVSPDLRKSLNGKLEDAYSKWESEVTQLFGGLAVQWRTTTDTTILFPQLNLSKTGPVDLMLALNGHSGLALHAYCGTRTSAKNWNVGVFDKEAPAYPVSKDQWLQKDAFAVKYLENPLWGLLWFPVGAGMLFLMVYFIRWPKNLNEVRLYNSARDDASDEVIWSEMRTRFNRVEDYLIRRLLIVRPGSMLTVVRARTLPTEPILNLFWRWLRQALRTSDPASGAPDVYDRLYDYAETWLMYVRS